MRVIDEECLDWFRRLGRCEYCKKLAGTEPDHWRARGMGGACRLDIRINLTGLCHECHMKRHTSQIKREELLAIIARRERVAPEWVVAEINRIVRLPKGSDWKRAA